MRRRMIYGLVGVLLLLQGSFGACWADDVRRGCLVGWDAVTTNSDATTITDLAGYRVYVSQVSGSYGAHTLQTNPDTTVASCSQLGMTLGVYYWRVTAIDDTGNESQPSAERTETVKVQVRIRR